MSAIYTGPQCPICDAPLDAASLRSGLTTCPSCDKTFEGTPFQPREQRHEAVQAVTQTPEGVAAACANHSGNAAVTTCQRCGLFICSLCDMNTGEGSYCPACFERFRTGTASANVRYRDYAGLAVSGAIASLFCMLLLGPFVIYWSARGIQQRRREEASIAGMIFTLTIGILETLVGFGRIVMMIIGAGTS